ncbi:MAG: DNA methyltransferase [Candidatus Woesearchaeota archaeon]
MVNKLNLIFHLKKPYLEIAKEEVISLIKPNRYFLFDDILLCEYKGITFSSHISSKIVDFYSKRLGFTHSIYNFIFKATKNNFFKKVRNYDWYKLYKKSFCVRYHGNFFQEKYVADLIYENLKSSFKKKPCVNLKKPFTKIEFFEKDDFIIAGLFLKEVDKTYLNRKAHLRPGFHPTSLSPDLARACINLTGLKKGLIFDPFCGSGGILIEAGLIGFNVMGIDIIKKQLDYAKINLDFYKIKNYKLLNLDERKITLNLLFDNKLFSTKMDFAIVSDLPYGKGSYGKDLENLYEQFLINSKDIMKTSFKKGINMVLIFPHFINYKKIIRKLNLKIKREFSYYVHKSLTRKIVVLNLN